MSTLFSVLLVAGLASAVTPVTAGADPATAAEDPTPVATWSNLGWSADQDSAGALSGGADAVGTVEIDWQAHADAVTGDTFTLGLPSLIRGDDRDSVEVQLATDDDYLGGTGTWSTERDELIVELEQDGLPDGEDSTELLGGTLSFDVVWSEAALEGKTSGSRQLRFTGPGLDGEDNKKAAMITAQYQAPAAPAVPTGSATPAESAESAESATASTSASSAAASKRESARGEAPSSAAAQQPEDDDTDVDTQDGSKASKAADAEKADVSEDSESAAQLPDRDRPAVEVGPESPEADKIASVFELFSGLVSRPVAQNVNSDIEVDIAGGEKGFRVVDPSQAPQLKVGTEVTVHGTWDATDAQVRPGEQFTVTLPKQLQAKKVDAVALVGSVAGAAGADAGVTEQAPVWGSCVTSVAGMVCTFDEGVADLETDPETTGTGSEVAGAGEVDSGDEAVLSGEFVIAARATSWVAPGAGVDVGLNGETVHRELPGDGGIADDFVQPALGVEAVFAQDVTDESQSQTSTWVVEIPGEKFLAAREADQSQVVVSGQLDTDGLGQGARSPDQPLRISAGRATASALPGARAELVPVADSETGEYEITVDVSEVDPEMLTSDLRYRLDYALEIDELIEEREGGSWVLDNTVTVAGESASATAAVAGPAASEGQMQARMAAAAVTDVCLDPSLWVSREYSGNSVVQEYRTDGTATGRVIDLRSAPSTSGRGFDVAMEASGEVMWSISSRNYLDAFSVATGEFIQRFEVNFPVNTGTTNSMSFSGDRLLIGGTGSSQIFQVRNLPTPVPGGPVVQLTASSYLDGGSLVGSGYAGDFVTLADGSLLAFAKVNFLGGTKFIFWQKNANSTFRSPVNVGQARTETGGSLTAYGGTFVSGSLFLAQANGTLYRYDSIPEGTSSSTHRGTQVSTSAAAGDYNGATSVQEANAICSSPAIGVTKSPGQVTGPDAQNHFTASYTVTVTNSGGVEGTYAALTDTPAFDAGLEVHGASWTGTTAGSAQGSGPFLIDNRNVNLASGASNTYQVVVEFSYPEGTTAQASACTPATPGTGLTNIAAVSGSSAINGTATNVACLTPPPVPPSLSGSVAWSKVAAGTSEMLAGSEWEITPVDAGGQPTGPAVQVQDCIEAAAAQCTGPDTDPSAGGFLVAALTNGQYTLVETKAPAGYVLDDTPRTVTVASGVALLGSIENTQQQGLVIPLTGGMGADKFLWGGAALAALVALMLALRHRAQRVSLVGIGDQA